MVSLSNHEQTTVLQIPHHGSATSSTQGFLDAIHPQYAVIQAGENNRYGFPKREVVERLHNLNIKLFRTDKDGAITFETDGKITTFYPFAP